MKTIIYYAKILLVSILSLFILWFLFRCWLDVIRGYQTGDARKKDMMIYFNNHNDAIEMVSRLSYIITNNNILNVSSYTISQYPRARRSLPPPIELDARFRFFECYTSNAIINKLSNIVVFAENPSNYICLKGAWVGYIHPPRVVWLNIDQYSNLLESVSKSAK